MDCERTKIAYRRQELLEQAENIGAALNGICVQHSPGSKTETVGVQLADLMTVEEVAQKLNQYQSRINRKIDMLVDRKEEAQGIIECIPLAAHRAVLIHRYMTNLRWPTIADIMGYTDTYVRDDLKYQAIAAFERAWQNYRQKPTDI